MRWQLKVGMAARFSGETRCRLAFSNDVKQFSHIPPRRRVGEILREQLQ